MQIAQHDWATLEAKLVQLAAGHGRLVELIEQQRQAIRKADPAALAQAGLRIEAEVRELARVESARRELCQQLAADAGLPMHSQSLHLDALCQFSGKHWGRRIRLAAGQLAAQIERVRGAGRINLHVAGRLSEFCGEVMGEVARVSRDTGCYDARGQRAMAREPIAAGTFSTVG